MGKHRMEHYRPQINTTSPIVTEAAIVETQRQPARIVVTQSFDVDIPTTRVETIVAPTMDVVRKGTLIRFTAKLGNGSSGVPAGRKLSGSLALPTATTRIVGTP